MTLVALSGLPGVGKSTLARALATRLRAVWLRIDSIEQAMADATGRVVEDDQGYRVAHAVAADNLRLGLCVVADSVNPLVVSRAGWRAVATAAGVPCLDVWVVCSDPAEHRRRVEGRPTEVAGLVLPTWDKVMARRFEQWDRPPLVVDTAQADVETCVDMVAAALEAAATLCPKMD